MPRLILTCAFLALCLPALAGPGKTDIKKAFKSGDKGQVESVLGELKGSLDKATVKAVFDNALRLRNLGVYDALVEALGTSSGEALTELVKNAKKSKKGNLRFLAIDALGAIKDIQAEAALLHAIKKDKDEPVRVLAARKLGKRGTKSAVDALVPLLGVLEKDKKASARLVKEVVSALQNLTGQDVVVAEDWANYWKFNREKHTPKTLEAGKSKARGNIIDRMKNQRPADLKTIKRIKKSELTVVKGNDKVEDVLKGLGLEHKLIKRGEFDSLTLDGKTGIVLLNCPGRDAFTDAQIQKVRKFVGEGGYLFVSDWDLKKTLAKAFPEAVQFLRESPKGSNKTVKIVPARGAREHSLMRDVFPLNTFDNRGFSWVMEQRSHLAKDSNLLVPLVSCPEIRDLGTTTVAFTFRFDGRGGGRVISGGKKRKRKSTGSRGKGSPEFAGGRVLFVSSHFKLQKDEKGDGYALQQLLLNFILEKQQRKTGKPKK